MTLGDVEPDILARTNPAGEKNWMMPSAVSDAADPVVAGNVSQLPVAEGSRAG